MGDISHIKVDNETHDIKDATARSVADSKVSSVTVGGVETGDKPSVVNTGDDKDVILDFVFPSGGGGQDSRIITGTFPNGEYITIPCSFCQVSYGGADTNLAGMAIYSAGKVKSVSTANGFDVSAASDGVAIDNYSGATAYYIAIIIE